MLPDPAARVLTKVKARRATERLGEISPYRMEGPVEAKVQFTSRGARYFASREDVVQVVERKWAFRGKILKDAWLKYSSSF